MPEFHTRYCRLERLHPGEDTKLSPVVFLHGFPDSPHIFDAYHTGEERGRPWLQGRAIYTLAFPNRFTNPNNIPPLGELASGVLQREVDALLEQVIAESPTGRFIPVAHDWGATCTWDYLRRNKDAPVEKMVSLSVGSSFRYDLFEHGLSAFAWLYATLNSIGFYLPLPGVRLLPGWLNQQLAGYRSDDWATVYQDTYHYWYGPLVPLQTPFRLVGIGGNMQEYTDFHFPVLYIRSPMDRIASTAAFEQTLHKRTDCRILVWQDCNHWFPEQQAQRVLAEIRAFL